MAIYGIVATLAYCTIFMIFLLKYLTWTCLLIMHQHKSSRNFKAPGPNVLKPFMTIICERSFRVLHSWVSPWSYLKHYIRLEGVAKY